MYMTIPYAATAVPPPKCSKNPLMTVAIKEPETLLKNSELPLWKIPTMVRAEMRGTVKRSVSRFRKNGVSAIITPHIMLIEVARAANRISSPSFAKNSQSSTMFNIATTIFIHMLKVCFPQMRR